MRVCELNNREGVSTREIDEQHRTVSNLRELLGNRQKSFAISLGQNDPGPRTAPIMM
jgi:hypothetical protein